MTGSISDSDYAIQQMVQAAYDAGMPRDQIIRFSQGGYIPQPQQCEFHAAARSCDHEDGPLHIATGGARGGAKSHAIMSQVALDDCQRYPGLDVLYLRMIQKAGRKALDQLRKKTFISLKHVYNRNEGLIRFPNGSSIVVGHFKNDGDIDKYVGIEYDLMVVEERTQLSKGKLDQLFGSLRTGKPGWRPRSYNATNPGGIGHMDFKEQFIMPYRQGTEADTKFIPMDWRFNKFINPEYKAYLMGLTGTLGRMWRDGDWDVGGGTFFINWDEDIHTIEPLKRIPQEWPMWVSMDWGMAHPCVVQWHVVNPAGHVFTIAEHRANRLLVAEHSPKIKKICKKLDRDMNKIRPWIAGHDIFANTGAHPDGKTLAEQFADEGIHWEKANTDRINGAAELTTRLGNPAEGIPATWFIWENCEALIETIPRMLSDEKRAEDVLKIDADEFGDGGDDSYDCARYGIMERPLMPSMVGFQIKY